MPPVKVQSHVSIDVATVVLYAIPSHCLPIQPMVRKFQIHSKNLRVTICTEFADACGKLRHAEPRKERRHCELQQQERLSFAGWRKQDDANGLPPTANTVML